MERADKWEWIIERCRKTGEPGLWQVASRKTPNPSGL